MHAPGRRARRSASGFPIRDRDLLEQALVHSSWLHEHPDAARGHNERLEFLGDAVVNLAVSEALYGRHPTTTRASCPRAARRSSAPPASPGSPPARARARTCCSARARRSAAAASRPSLLASAFEALVGAIYLDLGWEAARDWIHSCAGRELEPTLALTTLKSPKSRLQEHTQRTTGERPVVPARSRRSGPDHEKQFRIEVVVDGRVLGTGEGPSRRVAETSAAAEALEVLKARARSPPGPRRPRRPRRAPPSLDAEPAIEAEGEPHRAPATTGDRP